MNTTVKIGKNPNILQGMNRQSSVALHTMQSYSTIKRKIYWYTERHGWTSKTYIYIYIYSKRSQTQNTVHCRFIWHSGKTEIYGMKKLSNGCQRLGRGVAERECFGDDETVLHTDCGGSYKTRCVCQSSELHHSKVYCMHIQNIRLY